ncbi:MAG TPA: hypothetical protein DD730_17265 [Desulfosporosinus sp.]|nr:hypothetical protein [Desulfosporosinus sp.]
MKLVFLLRNKNLPSFHSNFHQYFYIITAVPKLMSAKRKGPRKWSPIMRALGAISVSFEVSESKEKHESLNRNVNKYYLMKYKGVVVFMQLWYLWAHGATLYVQPFAYFAPLLSFAAFIFIVYIITALKQVADNKN